MHQLGAPRGGSGAHGAPVPFAPPEQRRSRLARWFDSWMRSLGMAFVLFLVIKTFLLEAFQIPSGSMERTLLAGDFLFVNKAVYGATIPGTHAGPLGPPDRPAQQLFRAGRQSGQLARFALLGVRGRDRRERAAAGRVFQLRSRGARRRPMVEGHSLEPTGRVDPVSVRRRTCSEE